MREHADAAMLAQHSTILASIIVGAVGMCCGLTPAESDEARQVMADRGKETWGMLLDAYAKAELPTTQTLYERMIRSLP